MPLPTVGTLLVLSYIGVPLYSARGLTQTLTPIQQATDLRRDINGNLVDLSLAQFRKYASKITCRDFNAPALDGIWPGQVLTVSCVAELAVPAGAPLARAAVAGSIRVQADGFIFYRPLLQMMVSAISLSEEEYQADYAWELSLEEI
jgi:hypothetical protein